MDFIRYIELIPFVNGHLNDDITELLLSRSRYPSTDMKIAAEMISSRRKMDVKVPCWKEIKQLCFPDSVSAQQSSSLETATYKLRFLHSGRVADLTCGLGVDSLFMAPGCSEIFCYDKNPLLCSALEYNSGILGVKNIKVTNREIGVQPSEFFNGEHFDLIYIDPSRRDERGKRVLDLRDYSPDITGIKKQLLSSASSLLIKISPMADITATLRLLPETSQVHIISVANECKELLFYIQNCGIEQGDSYEPEIHMANYTKGNWQHFSSTRISEDESKITFAADGPRKYIYEPNSSIMKGGAFRSVSEKFSLEKLSVNTHLYTSDNLYENFPGRVFRLTRVHGAGKKSIKNIRENIRQANISVRNFPLTAHDLKKQTGITEGGEIFLTGCSLASGQKCILESVRVV